jgi:hypothetical protein
MRAIGNYSEKCFIQRAAECKRQHGSAVDLAPTRYGGLSTQIDTDIVRPRRRFFADLSGGIDRIALTAIQSSDKLLEL